MKIGELIIQPIDKTMIQKSDQSAPLLAGVQEGKITLDFTFDVSSQDLLNPVQVILIDGDGNKHRETADLKGVLGRGASKLEHPCTGIWDRQRIGGPSSRPSGIQMPLDSSSVPFVPTLKPPTSPLSAATEIHSASTELLGSESMDQLRGLLTDTYNEHDELSKEISSTALASNTAAMRYQKWECGFLKKRLFKQSFATLKESTETAAAKLEEFREQLRLTTLATEITLNREQADQYYRMRDDSLSFQDARKYGML